MLMCWMHCLCTKTVVSKHLSAEEKCAGGVQVQKPTRQQHKDSKMGPGKMFVVYFGTNEISALPKNESSLGAHSQCHAGLLVTSRQPFLKPNRL